MERGRPKKTDTPKIREAIRVCFLNGDTILGAADKTGYNFKTINLYYKEFASEIIEKNDEDFIQRQKTAKEIALFRLNKVIDEISNHYGILKEKAADEFDNDSWDRNKLTAMSLIGTLIQQRADIEMSPTLDVDIDSMVKHALEAKNKIDKDKPSDKPQK